MNGYDFDKTIYAGNSFADFYFYCLVRRPYIILLLPYQLILSILYLLRVLNRKQYKQAFHCYLFFVFGKMQMVDKFWQTRINRIKSWYLAQKQENDVIVSASPEFFLRPVCEQLGLKNLVATDMDMRTGLIRGENCYRQNKVKMFQQKFGTNTKLASFYSDSKKDMPMMLLAAKKYFVKGDVVTEYQM